MEDQQIVELYLQREEEALVQTQQKYTNYCRAVALRLLRSHEDADEAVNETWFAAWNSIPPHKPLCLQTFLGRLTRNISLKRIRSDNAQKRASAQARVVFDEVRDWLASDEDIEQEISEQELAAAINDFLGTVSHTERNVFVRRYWYMQSITEIAEALGFSESKVKSMLFRIRKKLYTKLEKEDYL